jgi:hypothetical protein
MTIIYFAHILFFQAYSGQGKIPNREPNNMTHSQVVLSDKDLSLLAVGEKIDCKILSFGRSTLEVWDDEITLERNVTYRRKHHSMFKLKKKNQLYSQGALWIIAPIQFGKNRKDKLGIESGYGSIKGYTADALTERAKRKYEHIEYTQTADRSSNCIGFSDNFIYYLKHAFTWNPRIPLELKIGSIR